MPSKHHKEINLIIWAFIMLLPFFLLALPVLAESTNKYEVEVQPTESPTLMIVSWYQETTATSKSSADGFLTSSIIITATQTLTPSVTITPTDTPSPTPSPTITPTPYPTQFSYLPHLYRDHFVPTSTPFPTPEPVLFCDSLGSPQSIPDNNFDGINNDIFISDARTLVDIRLYLNISHPYIGDLVVTLMNMSTGNKITVLNRPGNPPYGCSNDDIVTILDDGAIQKADTKCAVSPQAISGIYLPSESFQGFKGKSANGGWRLNVSDQYINDSGYLNHWCLETQLSDMLPSPTPSPTPVNLPPSAAIYGMSGQNQQLKLDCEARSAVDWAAHFGKTIDELEFQYHLPSSDDPESGFVGNPTGNWGNIPPADYGVHAPPAASLLNAYGLAASPYKSLSWDDLRAEIASGNPVITWIIGDNARNIVNGTPHIYTATSNGNISVVAPFEHTVILVGYTSTNVTVLNGARFMDIPIDQFLDSWSVLDFMAILAR